MDRTISHLIGELIMPRLDVTRFAADDEYASGIRALIEEQKVGGFCVFGGTPSSMVASITALQSLAKSAGCPPLIFSADCEWGLPMRLTEGGTEFPDAMAIARTGEPELAYAAGLAIAREMRALGIVWNFAPVADVNSNPKNPIINTRAFGDDAQTVQAFSVAFMMGLQSEGVAATAKHFPGHGDTSVDSHRELPIIERGWKEFSEVELPPFQSLIDAGVMSVMTGHLATPELAKHFGASEELAGYPATLSHAITTRLLREQLGFEGVIVTDALEMRAITDNYGAGEAAVLAFEAGADVLLLPVEARTAYDALAQAFESGRITENDIVARVERLRQLRQFSRISELTPNPELLDSLSAEHLAIAEEIADKAIELAGTMRTDASQLLILCDDRPQATAKAARFQEMMQPRMQNSEVITASDWSAAERAFDDNTIIATFHRARGYISASMSAASIPDVIQQIASSYQGRGIAPVGLVLFGSPYLDEAFLSPPGFVLKTFSESNASIDAVIKEFESATNE